MFWFCNGTFSPERIVSEMQIPPAFDRTLFSWHRRDVRPGFHESQNGCWSLSWPLRIVFFRPRLTDFDRNQVRWRMMGQKLTKLAKIVTYDWEKTRKTRKKLAEIHKNCMTSNCGWKKLATAISIYWICLSPFGRIYCGKMLSCTAYKSFEISANVQFGSRATSEKECNIFR